MPLVRLRGAVGGSARSAALLANVENSINYYPENQDSGTPSVPAIDRYTPGLKVFCLLPDGPVRALFSQNGRCFALGSTSFCEIAASQNARFIGTVFTDTRPTSMSSNGSAGNQVFFPSAGFGYVYDLVADTLNQIVDPDFPSPCSMMAFLDGYALALKGQGRSFQWSALEDATAWDALDVAEVSQTSDNLVSLTAVHDQLWLLGSQTGQVWADTGGTAIFAPIPGSLMQQGSAAAWSIQIVDNAPIWLGGNELGAKVVYRGGGSVPQRISTYAVETALNQYQNIADGISWSYQDQGHAFYVLYFPSAPTRGDHTTWVYDVSTQQWHERALWDDVKMRWEPHLGRCHTYAFGKHLVGDRLSPAIYEMSDAYLTDGQAVLA